MKAWEVLDTTMGYSHPFMKIELDKVKLPNGQIIDDYAVWAAPGVAQVVPMRADGRVLLVRLYKQGIGEFILEFPGGFAEEGETPEQAARRELHEETSLEVEELLLLHTVIHHPTKERGRTHLFLAKDVRKAAHAGVPDDTETIELVWVTLGELIHRIDKGQIKQTGTIAAAFLAQRKLQL